MALVGHSFINAAVYIGDARSRDLPLLFGLGSENHDWYNIFNMLGLLPLDGAFALLARLIGIAITASAALAAIYFAWVRGAKNRR
jgi:Zn-dependent protease